VFLYSTSAFNEDDVSYSYIYINAALTEEQVDKFEMAKCTHFKRMMIESFGSGAIVGVPWGFAAGSSHVRPEMFFSPVLRMCQTIEEWPLIQSFALDTVFTATGFFTSRYQV
jgi:hypothetical protein